MRALARSLGVCLAGFAILLSPSIADATQSSPALERLREAARTHPEDPDLQWALARELSAQGEWNAALKTTRSFVSRWPDRRPGARIEIARTFLDGGAVSQAAELLDEVLTRSPTSGLGRFYRGLAFRAEGLIEPANREFHLAGRLEPALLSETMLARALGLFDLEREEEAVTLLRRLLEYDPTSETATRARLLLREREMRGITRDWRADAYAGVEYDDNVTLESTEDELPATSHKDFRWLWGGGFSGRPWSNENASLLVGYRYDQTRHIHQNDFDILGNTLFTSGSWQANDDIVLRLDGVFSSTLQDLENELIGGAIQPNVLYSFGREWGVTRAFVRVELFEYDDDALLPQWERDGRAYGLGLEHSMPLGLEQSWISLSFSWARNETQAESDGTKSGFDGDFDYDGFQTAAAVTVALPFEARLSLSAMHRHDRFLNTNFAHFLSGATSDRKRRDNILMGRVGVSVEIISPLRFELYWRGTRRMSNVDLFDYDKQIAGALFRVSID